MTGVKCIGRGDIIWNLGDNSNQFIDRASHWGASHRGTWTGWQHILFNQTIHTQRRVYDAVKLTDDEVFLQK